MQFDQEEWKIEEVPAEGLVTNVKISVWESDGAIEIIFCKFLKADYYLLASIWQ